jgi:uncharacterized protein
MIAVASPFPLPDGVAGGPHRPRVPALQAGELEIDNALYERIILVRGWPRSLVTARVATAGSPTPVPGESAPVPPVSVPWRAGDRRTDVVGRRYGRRMQARFVRERDTQWCLETPTTRRERMRGLRGRAELPSDRVMLLERCRSVHTFGMRFPILVAGLDRSHRVIKVRPLAPRRFLLWPGVRHIAEAGVSADIRVGDRFEPF